MSNNTVSKSSNFLVDNVSKGFDNLFNDIDISLEKLLGDPYIMTSLRVFLGLYAAFAAPQLPKNIALLMDSTLIRIIFAAAIVYAGLKDPLTAILIAIVFIVTLQTANKYKLYDTSESITKLGGISWLPSAKLAQLNNIKQRNEDISKHNKEIKNEKQPVSTLTPELLRQNSREMNRHILNAQLLNNQRIQNLKNEMERTKLSNTIQDAIHKATTKAELQANAILKTNEETNARIEAEAKAREAESDARTLSNVQRFEPLMSADYNNYELYEHHGLIDSAHQLSSNVISGAHKIGSGMINGVHDLGEGIIQGVDELGTGILRGTHELGSELLKTVDSAGNTVLVSAKKLGKGVLKGVSNTSDGALKSAHQISSGVIDGTFNLTNNVLSGDIENGLITSVNDIGSGLLGGVQYLGDGVISGVNELGTGVIDSVNDLGYGTIDSLQHLGKGVIGGVGNVGQGVFRGVNKLGNNVVSGTQHLGNGLVGGITDISNNLLENHNNYYNEYFDHNLNTNEPFNSDDGLLESTPTNNSYFSTINNLGTNLLDNNNTPSNEDEVKDRQFYVQNYCNGDFTTSDQFNQVQNNNLINANQESCIQTFENQHCPQGLQQNQVEAYLNDNTPFNGDGRVTVGRNQFN